MVMSTEDDKPNTQYSEKKVQWTSETGYERYPAAWWPLYREAGGFVEMLGDCFLIYF